MAKRALLLALMLAAVLALALAVPECDAAGDQDRPRLLGQDPFGPHPMEPSMGGGPPAPRGHPPSMDDRRPVAPPADGPVIVFDASGIPAHAPDRITGLADAMDKKERMDDGSRSFALLDPFLDPDRDGALFRTMESMGFRVLSDAWELDGAYSVTEVDPGAGCDVLLRFLQHVSPDEAALCNLIYAMMQDMEGGSADDRSSSLSREDEEFVPESPESPQEGEGDSGSSETVYDVIAAPSAVETYLCAHVFDGGAPVFQ